MLTDRVTVKIQAPLLPRGLTLSTSSDERHVIPTMLRMARFAQDFQGVIAQQEAVEQQLLNQRTSDGESEGTTRLQS